MTNYREMYFRLTARIADAVELLQQAQQECEEIYMSVGNEDAAAEKRRAVQDV